MSREAHVRGHSGTLAQASESVPVADAGIHRCRSSAYAWRVTEGTSAEERESDPAARHLRPLRCRVGLHRRVTDKQETQTGSGPSGNPIMTTIWWHCARCGKRGMSNAASVLQPPPSVP
jgi:hypothetical protein